MIQTTLIKCLEIGDDKFYLKHMLQKSCNTVLRPISYRAVTTSTSGHSSHEWTGAFSVCLGLLIVGSERLRYSWVIVL